jgi:hypothetical protein
MVFFCAPLLFSGRARAQGVGESSSRTVGTTAAPQDPSFALRDVLAAACSESADGFARFFTPENEKVFRDLSPATRVALMKRFVLVDEPGVPHLLANASGRLLVRCETPSVTTEMQLGAADVQENLAFIPVAVRAAGDSAGTGARRVNIGLVREGGGWKLLSVGLLLLDLNALQQEWLQSDLEENEKEAIGTLGTLAVAVAKYRQMYGKLPESLAQLGPPESGSATPQFSALVGPDLAEGSSGGYAFRYVLVRGPDSGTPTGFAVSASPLIYGKTGNRSFLLDSYGAIRGADHKGALAASSDPRVDRPVDDTAGPGKD